MLTLFCLVLVIFLYICMHNTYLSNFLLRDIGSVSVGRDRPEGIDDLRHRLDVLSFSADHEGHVVLQRYHASSTQVIKKKFILGT